MTFDAFWEAWPGPKTHKNYSEYTRKKDRLKCERKWNLEGLDKKSAGIINNVQARTKYDKGWLKDNGKFLEAPLVYLNNERWTDEWADIRDVRNRSTRVPEAQQQDQGPKMSRWAAYANRVLFQLAYKNRNRGFRPLGESLAAVLHVKQKIVADAEQAYRDGDPWDDEEFKDVVYTALENALEENDERREAA